MAGAAPECVLTPGNLIVVSEHTAPYRGVLVTAKTKYSDINASSLENDMRLDVNVRRKQKYTFSTKRKGEKLAKGQYANEDVIFITQPRLLYRRRRNLSPV